MENNVLTIFTRIRQRLHTTARSIAGEDNADDVLQDAFCKLWTLKNMPPDQQQTERIAATIVKNVSIDYLRSAHRSAQPANVCGATDDDSDDIRETKATMGLFATERYFTKKAPATKKPRKGWRRLKYAAVFALGVLLDLFLDIDNPYNTKR